MNVMQITETLQQQQQKCLKIHGIWYAGKLSKAEKVIIKSQATDHSLCQNEGENHIFLLTLNRFTCQKKKKNRRRKNGNTSMKLQ